MRASSILPVAERPRARPTRLYPLPESMAEREAVPGCAASILQPLGRQSSLATPPLSFFLGDSFPDSCLSCGVAKHF